MQTIIDVLLIDDSDIEARHTLEGMRRALKEPTITRLKDGEIAGEFVFRSGLFKERPNVLPRLIVLEIDIPKSHGLEFIRRLRRIPETQSIPVVVFTRSHSPLAMDDAYAAGICVYVVKPDDRDEYLAQVAELVSRWLPHHDTPTSMS